MKGEIVTMQKDVFITTYDNPYDYFEQFDEWLNFDRQKGYYTLEYVARLAKLAPDLSEEEQNIEMENVFNTIIEWNGNFYKKVYSK